MNTQTATAPKKAKGLHPAIKSITSTDHKTTEIKAVAAPAKPANATRAAQLEQAKAAKAPKAPAQIGKRAQALADANAGKLPTPPDFSADTHKRFRPQLEAAIKLMGEGDIKGLEALDIKPVSSSRKALDTFRNLAVIALKAQATSGGAKTAPKAAAKAAEPHPDDASLTDAEKKLAGIPVTEAEPI